MNQTSVDKFVLILAMLIVLSTSACKTEYEKVRVSGNTELMYNKAFEYFENGDYLKAQGLFELIIPAYRGKKELEQIYFTYAYTYFHEERYLLAAYYFKNFASTFPTSDLRQEAEYMAAYSNYQMSPTFRLDQTYTEKAIDEFQLFINTFPESERVKDANRLIDQMRLKLERKGLAEGHLYFDLRQYQAAVLVFENLLKDFPETKNGEQIRYMIIRSHFLLAKNSVAGKQLERYKEVEKYAGDYLNKYNQSDYHKEVKSMLNSSKQVLKSLENERYQNQSAGTGT